MIPKGIYPITCPVGGMAQGAPWLKVPHSPLHSLFSLVLEYRSSFFNRKPAIDYEADTYKTYNQI